VDWWQIVLIILASIIIGLLAGYLLSYLIITVILKKPFIVPFIKRATGLSAEKQIKPPANDDLLAQLIEKRTAAEQQAEEQVRRIAEEARKAREVEEQERREAEAKQLAEEQAKRIAEEARKTKEAEGKVEEETVAAEEPLESVVPSIVREIENNYKVASQPWSGELLPFQTNIWEQSPQEVHALPNDIQESLTQAYADIRLANSIVWLSTELGRRSSNLDENYKKLCASVASRFEKIVPLLRQSGD